MVVFIAFGGLSCTLTSFFTPAAGPSPFSLSLSLSLSRARACIDGPVPTRVGLATADRRRAARAGAAGPWSRVLLAFELVCRDPLLCVFVVCENCSAVPSFFQEWLGIMSVTS